MTFACQQATMVNTKIIEESNVALSEASTDASRTISVSIKFNEDHSLTKIIMCINYFNFEKDNIFTSKKDIIRFDLTYRSKNIRPG